MRQSSSSFARALGERIGEILPPPLTVRADGAAVDVYADGICQGGSAAAVIVEDDDDRTPAERAESAALAVLSGIQDCVSEYLTCPWPMDAAGRMAMPGTHADAERLYLWFGRTESAAAVTLRPIDLREITGY